MGEVILLAANSQKRRYSFEQYLTLLRNNDLLSIPIEKRTLMPLEIIEPADEREDS